MLFILFYSTAWVFTYDRRQNYGCVCIRVLGDGLNRRHNDETTNRLYSNFYLNFKQPHFSFFLSLYLSLFFSLTNLCGICLCRKLCIAIWFCGKTIIHATFLREMSAFWSVQMATMPNDVKKNDSICMMRSIHNHDISSIQQTYGMRSVDLPAADGKLFISAPLAILILRFIGLTFEMSISNTYST